MIYIRNLFTQDLRDGKQIALPTEPSNLLFKFSFSNQDPERKISFKFKEKDNASPHFLHNDKIINTRLYSAGSEARIDGQLKQFLRDVLKAEVDDVIVFRAISLVLYEFEFISKGAAYYSVYKAMLNGKNHEVVIDQDNNEQSANNTTSPTSNINFGNLKEDFATWFIKLDGIKHNYYTDSFGSNRDKLIEQLSKYENIYKEQFGSSVFSLQAEEAIKFISELERNVYLEDGAFFQFSLKTSTHMPRAILGKKNYLKFIKELLAEKEIPQTNFNLNSFQSKTSEAGLIFSTQLIQRFIASLCTKPFVICSGLSGSGKTKLAQAFAQWITENESQFVIVPVGADWTNREPLLGYPNALNKEEYVSPENGALDLMIRAKQNIENTNEPTKPYFLILDEMNLSHVERYFADFLSTMESGDKIPLHKIKNDLLIVPPSIKLPKNLFIIGTVNIDETTYMFSPKVLDRANTIEFRLTEKDLEDFIASDVKLDMDLLKAHGANMAESFMAIALQEADKNLKPSQVDLKLFFNELKKSGAEFGYRTASEIGRLMSMLELLGEKGDNLLDIAIMQKLLPKLHGSRNKLTKVLPILGGFCLLDYSKIKEDYFDKSLSNSLTEAELYADPNIKYKISFEKICRMYKNAVENGFASYAEA
jgi:MoxR-like ATPase